MIIRLVLLFTLFLFQVSYGENLNLIDNYNHRSFENKFKKSSNKKIIKKVNEIVYEINNLVNFKKFLSIKSRVILDEMCPNAFAIGNNYIFICEDLAAKLNKCELTYVIAHEISHIYNEDFKNSYNRLSNTKHETIDEEISFNLNTKNKYSRIQEIIADRDSVVWSSLLGCKENDLLNAANKIFSNKNIKNSTHPDKKYRIQTVKDMIRKLNFIKNNNYKDAELLYEIDDNLLALERINEYILYNFNELKGYQLRIKINKTLSSIDTSRLNQVYQDCRYISRFFNDNTNKNCN